MKLRVSLSAGSPESVLRTIAATIASDNPGPSTTGTYTNRSCYGRVAHYLRTHWDPHWQILLFGDKFSVDHAVLWDPRKSITVVDSFSGKVVMGDKVMYSAPTGWDYPLTLSIGLDAFKHKFM